MIFHMISFLIFFNVFKSVKSILVCYPLHDSSAQIYVITVWI